MFNGANFTFNFQGNLSTCVNDLADALVKAGLVPQTAGGGVTGPAHDFQGRSGQCFAIQTVGAVDGIAPTLNGKIQESDDGLTNWTDVTGAAFTTVTGASNLQVKVFSRVKRYLRYTNTMGGTAPSFDVAAIVGQ